MSKITHKWACPQCGSQPEKHGKGGATACDERGRFTTCTGFTCECWDAGFDGPETDAKDHGHSLENPCRNAVCHHCGWSGVYPKPKGKPKPWEKRALESGWTPPKGWGR